MAYFKRAEFWHRDAVFEVMNRASQHTFQVLTKRPGRVAALNERLLWTPNIWLGVSIESEMWMGRLDQLKATGAHTKFLSLEPLLGPLPGMQLQEIDWVIVGGESGSGARPMDAGLGAGHPRQLPTKQCAVLFQAMGWCIQEEDGPDAR